MNQLAPLASSPSLPAIVAAAGERAGTRFLEFFASTIRNPHTRRAYGRAVGAFLAWCEEMGVASIAAVQPLHVAAWIDPRSGCRPTRNAVLIHFRCRL
jgi:integrase/recombinase XerC